MKAWVISITAVTLLSVILDLFIAEGETKKYIRGICGLLVLLVIISPLPKLLKKDFNVEAYFNDVKQETFVVDNTFIDRIHRAEFAQKELYAQKALEGAGIKGAVVDISIFYSESMAVEVASVMINLNNAVITEMQSNIDISDKAKKTVSAAINIEESRITVYGSASKNA